MPHALMEVEEVPYRCPKCGEGEGHGDLRFTSLRALRDHLEQEHSYLTKRPDSKLSGRKSPLTESFNKEARELERQLKLAKETELKHRQLWQKLVEPSNSALENIDRELRRSRQQKQELDEALNDAMDKIEHMRRSADLVTEEQKDAVRRLQERLSEKETDLDLVKSELRGLGEDKRQLEREVKDLSSREGDREGLIGRLRHEIHEKEHQIEEKQKEVGEMQEFLKDTAQKEAVARNRLEDFIEGLFERTEVAESQVQQMRRSLALSQEGLADPTSLPLLTDPTPARLPAAPGRRQLPHIDVSRSTGDILGAGQPSFNPLHSNTPISPLDRSQSADPLLSSQSQTPSNLPPLPMNGHAHVAHSSALPMNGLPQTAPPKGYPGDRTSDYGSMSSYAVTSPKSQPSTSGALDTAPPTHHLNHVIEDTVHEEPIVPVKKESQQRGLMTAPIGTLNSAQDSPLASNPIHISTQRLDGVPGDQGNHYSAHATPLTGSHGDGLDVDEHGIMWDTDVQVLPPHGGHLNSEQGYNVMAAPTKHNPRMFHSQPARKDPFSPVMDTPASQNTEMGAYHHSDLDLAQVARRLEHRPLYRVDSTTSSQQEIVEEINRNTEKILSQQRDMLSKQLSFLAKQQEFFNKGFAELRLQQRGHRPDSTSLEEEAESEEGTYTETEEEEDEDEEEEEEEADIREDGSITNVTENTASESEQETAVEARDDVSEHSRHTVLSVREEGRPETETEQEEGPPLEYHPQSSLPLSQPSPLQHRPVPAPRSPAAGRIPHPAPAMYPGRDHDRHRHRRHLPKKYRGRFTAPGYKNDDIKHMVTTTMWAVPTVSPYSRSPLNALPHPSLHPYHRPSPRPDTRLHLPQGGASTKAGRDLEALFCVLMYLDVFSLSQVAQVCKAWQQLSQHPALWRSVTLRRVQVSSRYLIHIARFCTELQQFTMEGLQPRPRRSMEDVSDYRKKTRGCLEEGLEAVMRVSGATLKTLKVIDCGNLLTDSLQDVTYMSDLDPVGSEVIWSLGAGCRQITRLIIPPMFPNQNPHKFNNHCAFNIARCWSDLQSLSIGGVDVTARGLAAIAHFCSKLQCLELDHMCEITEETAIAVCRAGFKGLRALHLTFTPITPKALLHFTSACPYLSNITVRVGISDYYEDTEHPQHREEFATIISKLRKLQQRPGFQDKLHLNVDYGPQKLAMPAASKT